MKWTKPGGNDGGGLLSSAPITLQTPDLTVGYILKMFPRFSETFILNEILELERRGVRVVVFSMKIPNESMRQPRLAELQARTHLIPDIGGFLAWKRLRDHLVLLLRSPLTYVKAFHFAFGRGTSAAWKKFWVAPSIAAIARREGVEHFHAHFASGPARQAKFASLVSGIPFSFTAHAKDLYWKGHNHGSNNKLKKRVRLASFVITISEYNRRFVHSLNFKVPRRRVVTLYNALNLKVWPYRRPDGLPILGSPKARPLILAVGRLVSKKGFDVLLAACRELKGQGEPFRCVIAGDGPERARLESLVSRYNLQDFVELPGSIPQDRLAEHYYLQACVLVQPSVVDEDGDQDGIPTVILEALALGLPVVATDVSGIAEAVIPGVTGLLAQPGDARALADAIRALLADRTIVARLSRQGRELVEHRFDLQKNAKVLIHLMRVAARGDARWSELKLRERSGVLPHSAGEQKEVPHGLGVQG